VPGLPHHLESPFIFFFVLLFFSFGLESIVHVFELVKQIFLRFCFGLEVGQLFLALGFLLLPQGISLRQQFSLPISYLVFVRLRRMLVG